MKHSLLLFLALPFSAFGQYNRSYTGPTMQQNMQSRQQFNQMTNQRTLDFQQRVQQRQMAQLRNSGSRSMSPEEQQKAQAKQLQLEKDANEKLAQLTQDLQRKREAQPAANPQQAALQQKKDNKQLTKLAVKNYREVFLPGQVTSALQAQLPAAQSQRQLLRLNKTLSDKAWWKKHEDAQLTGAIKAYGDTLGTVTTALLGFDLATPPALPAPFSVSGLNAQLATDAFDQAAVTQLVQNAALTAKLNASKELIKAVQDFTALTAAVASQEPQSNPKKLRDDVQESLHLVEKAMGRYYAQLGNQTTIADAQKALLKSTAAYLAKK